MFLTADILHLPLTNQKYGIKWQKLTIITIIMQPNSSNIMDIAFVLQQKHLKQILTYITIVVLAHHSVQLNLISRRYLKHFLLSVKPPHTVTGISTKF